jgi:methylated-DNA-[protein]-cysteine S-methyltransferase
MPVHFALFDTELGPCAVAWQESSIVRVWLPTAHATAMRKRIKVHCPDAVEAIAPPPIRTVLRKIQALLVGKAVDLSDLQLEMNELPSFHQRVYAVVRRIPRGKTYTYQQVATQVGSPKASRAVGQAMARNPFPLIVPCHRVTAAHGKLGGFTADGGTQIKLWLLDQEGATLNTPKRGSKNKAVIIRQKFSVRKAINHLRAVDEQMAKLIEEIGPYRMTVNYTQDVFLALAEAIIYQQLHGKAAATIFKRVCALFPHNPEGFTAKDIVRCDDQVLRAAGLSHNKLLALRDLANKTNAGEMPTLAEMNELDNETIIKRLTVVRGIGRWTVEMLLMFKLGRADVLPVDDYGIRKGFMLTFNQAAMPTPKALHLYGERWAPYRSVASWYLWRAADRAKTQKA